MTKLLDVAIIMGSKNDGPIVKQAESILRILGIQSETKILSAHRTPTELIEYVKTSPATVFIAAAGGAAALAGVVAAHTTRPVIAVPIKTDMAGGLDSLLSSIQMPKGIPVACVGVNNAENAALLAAAILATGNYLIATNLKLWREKMKQDILDENK